MLRSDLDGFCVADISRSDFAQASVESVRHILTGRSGRLDH